MRLIYWKVFLPLALLVADAWWLNKMNVTSPAIWETQGDLIRNLHWPLSMKLQSWFEALPGTMQSRGSWWPVAPLFLNTLLFGFILGALLDWRLQEQGEGSRGLKDSLMRQFGAPKGLMGRLCALFMNLGNKKLNQYAVQALDVQPHDRILDMGFGGGVSFKLILANIASGNLTGLDPSATMLSRARKQWARPLASGRLRLAPGSVDKHPFADEAFDKCLTVNTIYFWPNLKAGLKEIKRVLRPGGKLVIGMRDQKVIGKFRDYGFAAYSEGQLARDLFKAGFEKVEIEDRPDGKWGAKIVTALRRDNLLYRDDDDRSTDELVDDLEKNLGRMLDISL